MKLKLLRGPGGFDASAFLSIFRQSSLENAPEWYPELSPEAALEKYEAGFLEYMEGPFWDEGGILALLEDDTGYRSSLRLYPQSEQNHFYLEALETRPDSRRQGFGLEVLRRTAETLEGELGPIQLTSSTGKGNIASRATHAAAGFVEARDYWQQADGTRDEGQVTLIYRTAP